MSQCKPIFIAGCGRSGTTYLRTTVDAHEDVFIPTESLFIADYLRFGDAVPRRILEWLFYREPQLRAWYSGPRESIDDICRTIEQVHRLAAQAEGKRTWGQKTPRFVRHMDLFRRCFPGCRWILIHRDPRAVVASMLKSPRHSYSIARACKRWVRDNRPVIAHLEAPREDTLVVSYEDLIRNYDQNLVRIFSFLGLTPLSRAEVAERGRVREYQGTGFKVSENNVRQGLEPHVNSIDSWKKSLNEAQVHEIERRCGREMSLLGYERLVAGYDGSAPSRWDRLSISLASLKDVLIVYQYTRHWPYYPIHTAIRKIVMWLCSSLRTVQRWHGRATSACPSMPLRKPAA